MLVNRSNEEERECIVKLAAAGWSRRQIAREMRLPAVAVLRHLRWLQIAVPRERKEMVKREPEEVCVGDEI